MLGWEYPPRICGGLGVACHGLAEELAKRVSLRLIVPGGVGGEMPEEARPGAVPVERLEWFRGVRLERVAVRLFPYATDWQDVGLEVVEARRRIAAAEKIESPAAGGTSSAPAGPPVIELDALYGPQLPEAVEAFAEAVEERVAGESWEAVHAHDWMTWPAALRLREKLRVPVVLHVHSLQFDRAGPGARDRIWSIEEQAMAMADRVVAVSARSARICAESYGVDRKKLRVVFNGGGSSEEPPGRSRAAGLTVVFVGRLTPQKGPLLFLEVAARIRRRHRGVKFVMLGEGEMRAVLEERAERLQLDDVLEMPGFVPPEEVATRVREAAVFFMPSVSEPFGLAALEAARLGVPVVLSEQCGVGEVLRSAPRVHFWDIDGAAKEILSLLERPAERRALGDAMRQEAARVTWKEAADRLVEVFRELPTGVELRQTSGEGLTVLGTGEHGSPQ